MKSNRSILQCSSERAREEKSTKSPAHSTTCWISLNFHTLHASNSHFFLVQPKLSIVQLHFGAKTTSQMHKLSHKSAELIPPARQQQHRDFDCISRVPWNKFTFFLSFSFLHFSLVSRCLFLASLLRWLRHSEEIFFRRLLVSPRVLARFRRFCSFVVHERSREQEDKGKSFVNDRLLGILQHWTYSSSSRSLVLCNCFIVTHFPPFHRGLIEFYFVNWRIIIFTLFLPFFSFPTGRDLCHCFRTRSWGHEFTHDRLPSLQLKYS